MKEGIFLLYKKILEPRFNFIRVYSLSVLKSRKLFNVLLRFIPEQNQVTKVPFNYRYLLIKNKSNSTRESYYLEKGIEPLVIEANEIEKLDKNYFYLILGQYEEVLEYLNHLRSLQIKVILDQTWMPTNNNKPIWKRRVSIVEAIYSDLMTENINQEDKYVILDEKNEWIDFEQQIFEKYLANKEEYKILVNQFLKEGWEWQRINPITFSIILEAISEYHTFNTPKAVLITQSVKTAKNYCGDIDYKIINALLDNYFKALI